MQDKGLVMVYWASDRMYSITCSYLSITAISSNQTIPDFALIEHYKMRIVYVACFQQLPCREQR